jgi:hypothetical protein
MAPLEEIFCFIDDFCKHFEQAQSQHCLPNPERKRTRLCRMSLSEIMTVLILFQFSQYRTFKDFYLSCLSIHYKKDFPTLVSYTRFLELIPFALMPLLILLLKMPGKKTGRYYVDSTKLFVCHNLRIRRHKVFEGLAKRGKTSTGWFFGFKLHLIINDKGELMNFTLTPGNTDDRTVVTKLMQGLKGWLFGDRGYISKKLAKTLENQGVSLITTLKKNMKKQFIEPIKKYWLRKRGIIETIIDQLKAIFHLQHTRHRSVANFFTNILAALLAYTFKPKKPSVSFAKSIPTAPLLIAS